MNGNQQTHSVKALQTMALLDTKPTSWKGADIQWRKEFRAVRTRVRCHVCNRGYPDALNQCAACLESITAHGRTTTRSMGTVLGVQEREVWVGKVLWPPETKFDSRFQRGSACGLCGRAITKTSRVPVVGKDFAGDVHGMWVGEDCARRFLPGVQTRIESPDGRRTADGFDDGAR